MKILLLDIETSPNTAYVWGLFKENIPLARLIESRKTLCWSAKWYGEKNVMFDSIHQSSEKQMLKGIHKLLSQADVVIHYNGKRFDIPNLNREFIVNGMKPPKPYKQVDLLQVAREQFQFTSNKLAYVTKVLGIPGKVIDTDFTLWVKCMNNDPKAWKEMEAYNKLDVILLERVYDKFVPWIKSHPNYGTYQENAEVCPNCGGTHYHKEGFAYTKHQKYQQYACNDCGTWFRSNKTLTKKGTKKHVGI